MSLPKYSELSSLNSVFAIKERILELEKNLLDYRVQHRANKLVAPYLFVHEKRRLAQLQFKKSLLLKKTKEK